MTIWKTGETSASSVRLGRLMQTSLPAIAQAARRDNTKRFRGLYSLLNRNNYYNQTELLNILSEEQCPGGDFFTEKEFTSGEIVQSW